MAYISSVYVHVCVYVCFCVGIISQCLNLDLTSPVFCRRAVQVPSTWPIYPLCMYMCVCMSVSVLV